MAVRPRDTLRAQGLWPEGAFARVALICCGLVLFVLAFFFLLAVLAVASVVAAVILARWWWLSRKLARARDKGTIEGDYVVVKRTDEREFRLTDKTDDRA